MTSFHRPDGLPRVVVTGIGMVSAAGHTRDAIVDALRHRTSGVHEAPDYVAHDLRTTVTGRPHAGSLDDAVVPRKLRRFMGDTALYACHAGLRAVADAGLDTATLSRGRCGVVVGSGTGAMKDFEAALDVARESGAARVLPYVVPRAMSSTAQAALSALFDLRGVGYAISSACSTSIHCVGHAVDVLQLGRQDVMLAGGSEEAPWGAAMCFDAMGVLSRAHNATPEGASRPFDAQRDGFVLGGGAAILVLETLAHAMARGARPLAEITGVGSATCASRAFGVDIPTMSAVVETACRGLTAPPTFISAHANGSIDGDIAELHALAHAFGGVAEVPAITSIKGLTGHTVAAAGAMQIACAIWAMHEGFVPGVANLACLDAAAAPFPIQTALQETLVSRVLINTFGFGGTYGALTLARV
ncbi:beta-ketoacyl-[acyl-carrier-protein] synthase I [Pandoraea sp. NE5]|uniref:beta-ketoacyl-[acyl-carrier-protein] synthase family protein n=1 Tax=unclassified Pandoraea TaxID=2624094 RepID=UPI000A4DB296|nr:MULTISPECIES: beta-ketoacyl synthase N-terminal-like domain-containing protein [unclassified Pandoraea]BDD94026.1 beta-ketoacyl-[acyl-carrier-protein] synthase I [Pandoraea sp. NE5]